jgi:broad specificity phosphatase PhoE
MLAEFPTFSIPPAVTDLGWYHASGEESVAAFRSRVEQLAGRLQAEARALQARSIVLAVTHHGTICALLEALVVPERDFGDGKFMAFKTANTSITVVDIDGASGEVSLTVLGSVPHLASQGGLVTVASI